MKDIRSAQIRFKTAEGRYGTLIELYTAGLIRPELATGIWSGYIYAIDADPKGYRARAVPKEFGPTFHSRSGGVGLYLDESGIIRLAYGNVKNPSVNDEPLPKHNQ